MSTLQGIEQISPDPEDCCFCSSEIAAGTRFYSLTESLDQDRAPSGICAECWPQFCVVMESL